MCFWNENWLVEWPQCWDVKRQKVGVLGSDPTVVGFMTHTQSQSQVFGNGAGGGGDACSARKPLLQPMPGAHSLTHRILKIEGNIWYEVGVRNLSISILYCAK